MSKRPLSPSATLLLVLSTSLIAPFGMAVAMLARAASIRGEAIFLHPEDLSIGLRVTVAVILTAAALVWLRRATGRPVPLGPMLLAATLVGLHIALNYGLDPSRLQRQLAVTESIQGVKVPSDDEFRARYGAKAPIDFDSDQYLAFVNEAIGQHNDRLLKEGDLSEKADPVPLLVRQETLRDEVNQAVLAGLLVILATAAVATLQRGLLLALLGEGWYLLIAGGLAVQIGTLLYNWPHRAQLPALISLGPWITSPVGQALLVLGEMGYLAKVSAGVNARGHWLRGAVPRIPVLALWPFWIPVGISVAAYFAQRDLGSVAVLLVTAAVLLWVAFSPGRTAVLMGLGALAAALVAVAVAQGLLSADTARERVLMALAPDSYFRQHNAANTAVDAYWQLARDGGAPVGEQVAVVNGYLDEKYCQTQPWSSAAPGPDSAHPIVSCVQERRKLWGEGLPVVERQPTQTEYEIADGLWWYLRNSGLPQTLGLGEGLRIVETRLSDAVGQPDARLYDRDNLQQLLVDRLLNDAGFLGHGLGYTRAGKVPNNDTDFPVAIVADQMGAAGFLMLCLALYALVALGFAAATRASTTLEALLASTAAAQLGAYTLINFAGTLGLPASGVPLPFMSRGGTFFIVNALMVGIITGVAAWPGSPRWVEPQRRARDLIVGRPGRLPWPPAALALLVFPAIAMVLLAMVRPALAPAIVGPDASAGLPPSPWAPRVASIMASNIAITSAEGEVIVADTSPDGKRAYPDASGSAASDPCSPGRTLLSLLGLPDGGPVQGVEQQYRQGDYGTPKPGSTVVMTIDADLQRALCEEWLAVARQQVKDGSELRGAVIAIETDTGATRAAISWPNIAWEDFRDPDRLRQMAYEDAFPPAGSTPSEPLLNRAMRLLTTPGSVAKIVTAACAVEAGVVDDRTVLNDTGDIKVDGVEIQHDNIPAQLKGKQDDWSLFEAIGWSLNGFFGRVASAVNPERYLACVRGLGVITGPQDSPGAPISLPHELAHLDANSVQRPFGLITAGFGQGTWLMSPLHLAIIYAAVDRGGSLPMVHLVEGVRGADGSFTPAPDAGGGEWRRGWSEQTNALIAQSLIHSATPGQGWAGKDAPELIHRNGTLPTGAKTGTAELKTGGPYQSWVAVVSPVGAAHGLSIVVVIEHGGEGALGALQVVDRALARVDASALLARTARP